MAGNSTNGDFRNPADRNQRDERRSSDSPPAEVISGWMVARLSELLGIAPHEIDVREPFASYGLGSTELVSLSGELAEWLRRPASPLLTSSDPSRPDPPPPFGRPARPAPAATPLGPPPPSITHVAH